MLSNIFRQVRYSLYCAFVLNGILIQWIIPLRFKCDHVKEKCFACGMRTAINLLLHGDFKAAYHSNKLIIVVIILCMIMIFDILLYGYRYIRLKKE